ncbi:DUF2585 family protein [Mesorhizobium qingshengii]|uniref:DUF2585 family protein n=1 Tax=Mesorhizobium qingshengii TaxID=1165689 RepID=A0ABT4R2U1_9HYPH|nr:DUF2585 family protein [Mesorhizobium qingshengii]MCZ8548148.1 DUF2585 family protein [Mesorhizobium qingshengii]
MNLHVRIPVNMLLVIGAALIALQAVVLVLMGHPLICTCGTVKLWHGIVSSPENSQQLTDWYTYTHVIHGFGFYLLLWLIAPRLPFGLKLSLAIGLEATWEVVENTPFVIDRYRQSALAQGYFGDSVVNSVADTFAATFGFVLARILPVWSTVVLVIGMELFAAFMIRDNLMLNIIQLIHPSEAISRWQMGG